MTAGSQLFVISYGSNDISVFNTTTSSTTPSAVVHLETLLQPGDMDGFVDAAAAAYDPTSQLLYVVLGNVNTAATYTYMDSPYTLCGATKSSVIAIDVTTASVVSLQGTAPGGGIALQGYDPSGPTGLVYDAAGSRLLVFEAGCNAPPAGDAGNTGDAGAPPGPLKLRGVEEVNLTTKTSSILLDASTQGFPGSLIYIDSTHAVVGFSFPSSTFSWDPTSTTLGAALPNAPATFDYDGKGNLVGATLAYGDSGTPTTDIVSMALSNGTVTTLQSNVVELGMYGYAASVGVWPRP